MTMVANMFVMLMCINILIVLNGYTFEDMLTDYFMADSSDVSTEFADVVNPANFTGSSVNTGDPANSEFKLLDPISTISGFFNIVATFLTGPIVMASALQFPSWLIWLVAVPMTVLFWLSAVLTIRGVGG